MLFQNNEPSWGLAVLLVSKAAGVKKKIPEVEQDNTTGKIKVVVSKNIFFGYSFCLDMSCRKQRAFIL